MWHTPWSALYSITTFTLLCITNDTILLLTYYVINSYIANSLNTLSCGTSPGAYDYSKYN